MKHSTNKIIFIPCSLLSLLAVLVFSLPKIATASAFCYEEPSGTDVIQLLYRLFPQKEPQSQELNRKLYDIDEAIVTPDPIDITHPEIDETGNDEPQDPTVNPWDCEVIIDGSIGKVKCKVDFYEYDAFPDLHEVVGIFYADITDPSIYQPLNLTFSYNDGNETKTEGINFKTKTYTRDETITIANTTCLENLVYFDEIDQRINCHVDPDIVEERLTNIFGEDNCGEESTSSSHEYFCEDNCGEESTVFTCNTPYLPDPNLSQYKASARYVKGTRPSLRLEDSNGWEELDFYGYGKYTNGQSDEVEYGFCLDDLTLFAAMEAEIKMHNVDSLWRKLFWTPNEADPLSCDYEDRGSYERFECVLNLTPNTYELFPSGYEVVGQYFKKGNPKQPHNVTFSYKEGSGMKKTETIDFDQKLYKNSEDITIENTTSLDNLVYFKDIDSRINCDVDPVEFEDRLKKLFGEENCNKQLHGSDDAIIECRTPYIFPGYHASAFYNYNSDPNNQAATISLSDDFGWETLEPYRGGRFTKHEHGETKPVEYGFCEDKFGLFDTINATIDALTIQTTGKICDDSHNEIMKLLEDSFGPTECLPQDPGAEISNLGGVMACVSETDSVKYWGVYEYSADDASNANTPENLQLGYQYLEGSSEITLSEALFFSNSSYYYNKTEVSEHKISTEYNVSNGKCLDDLDFTLMKNITKEVASNPPDYACDFRGQDGLLFQLRISTDFKITNNKITNEMGDSENNVAIFGLANKENSDDGDASDAGYNPATAVTEVAADEIEEEDDGEAAQTAPEAAADNEQESEDIEDGNPVMVTENTPHELDESEPTGWTLTNELSWTLTNELLSGSGWIGNIQADPFLVYSICLPINECWTLSLSDAGGDGLVNGYYKGYLAGEEILSDDNFLDSAEHKFCAGKEKQHCSDYPEGFQYRRQTKKGTHSGYTTCEELAGLDYRAQRKICNAKFGPKGSAKVKTHWCLETCGKVGLGRCQFLEAYHNNSDVDPFIMQPISPIYASLAQRPSEEATEHREEGFEPQR